VGIQPELIDWGESPSEAVAEAIPRACQEVVDIMERWRP
jgi:hydrogenase maturation protease